MKYGPYITLAEIQRKRANGSALTDSDIDWLIVQLEHSQMRVKALRCDECADPVSCGLTVVPLCRMKERIAKEK